MRQELFEMFGSSSDLPLETIITRLAVASVIAGFIFLPTGSPTMEASTAKNSTSPWLS